MIKLINSGYFYQCLIFFFVSPAILDTIAWDSFLGEAPFPLVEEVPGQRGGLGWACQFLCRYNS